MMIDLDTAIRPQLEPFLRNWGSIPWRRSLDGLELPKSVRAAAICGGLAGIEADAFSTQDRLRRAGIMRIPALAEFTSAWAAEEADHSRILTHIERIYLADESDLALAFDHRFLRRDRFSVASTAMLSVARPFHAGMTATYLILACMTEYVASAVYKAIGDAIPVESAAEVLSKMARQEARHLRFYLGSAHAVLASARYVPRFARVGVDRFWRPPGMDLMGEAKWREIFLPVFLEPSVLAQMMRMDAFFGRLPGFEGLDNMTNFLARSNEVPIVEGAGRSELQRVFDGSMDHWVEVE